MAAAPKGPSLLDYNKALNKGQGYNYLASTGYLAGPVNPNSGYKQPTAPVQNNFNQPTRGVPGESIYNPPSQTQSAPSQPQTYYDPGTSRQFSSYDAYANEVNNAYGDVNNLLGGIESNTRAGEQDLYNSFTKPYDAQLPLLQQGRDQGLAVNQQQQDQTRVDEQNAIAAARRLYQELTQGSRQRFGAGSSAGEFAGGLLGREFQRNYGQIQNTTGQNVQQLMTKAQDITEKYNAQLQQINLQKEASLSQARDEFRRRIDAINNSKVALAENKAQMKLAELQRLRANVDAINNNFISTQQQLQANIAALAGQTAANVQTYNAQAGKPVDVSQIAQATYSAFGQPQAQTQAPAITGYYNPEDRRRLGLVQ